MTSSFARNAIILGLLSASGPFAIDMYLPGLPTIAADLGADTASTQMTLISFFGAVAVFQIVYGPWSDIAGRKVPLYSGLALFCLASIGCMFAPSIGWLIACRFLQGIGACAAMTLPRAIVRDLHTGTDAARLMSLIMLVFSVSPILAPLSGSILVETLGWRSVFGVTFLVGVLGLVLVAFALNETRPPEKRVKASFRGILAAYGKLLRDGYFLGTTFIGGLGMASFFGFLATSSFVYIEHFGLSPSAYGVAFSINAIGFIGAAQFSSYLGRRFGLRRVVRTAVGAYATMAFILFAVWLAGVDSLPVLMTMLFLTFACLGLVIPSTAVLALDSHGPIAGMAAALMGTLQLVAGAVVIGFVSLFFDGTALPMVTSIAFCAAGTLILSLLTLSRPRQPLPEPAE